MSPSRTTRTALSKQNAEKWPHFSAFLIRGIIISILLLGLALRLYGLDSKGFWGDEIFQARQSLRPLDVLLTRGQTPEIYDDFALHFVLLHFVGQLGQSEFWLRVPSVGYSILAMVATSLIGARLFGRGAGLVVLLLMAVAPFQIWYAQETRMYAAHTFYSALSFYFFIRLFARATWVSFLGMTIANVLGFYNHLFMVFPLLVEGIVGATFVIGRWQRRTVDRRGEMIIGSLIVTFLLSVPLLLGFFPFLSNQVSLASGELVNAAPKIDLSFIRYLVLFLSLGADWSWRVILSVGLALLGFSLLLRRDWRMVWIALVFVLPLVTLYLVTPAGNIAHRYLIFMQPLYLVLMAGAVWWVARGAVAPYTRRESAQVYAGAAIATVSGLVLLSIVIIPPLLALYSRAKLNDWRAVTSYIRAHGADSDLVRLERAPWAERAFRWYYPEARARFASAAELSAAQTGSTAVWYVSFGGQYDAESEAWAAQHLVRVSEAEWQQPNLVYTLDDAYEFPQSESQTVIYRSEWGR